MRSLLLLALAVATTLLQGCNQLTPLHIAAQDNDVTTVRKWIASRAALDPLYDEPTRGLEGNYARRLRITPLMMAAEAGHLEVVQALVEAGADVSAQSDTQVPGSPKLPFDHAAGAGQLATAEYLLKKTPRVQVKARLAAHLATALAAESFQLASLLLRTVNEAQRTQGITDGVCHAPRPSQVAAFLEVEVGTFPATSLSCLVEYGGGNMTEASAAITRMLARGASLEATQFNATPLMRATDSGNPRMVELLLALGARADARNADGINAAGYAASRQCFNGEAYERGRLESLHLLIRAGAEPGVHSPELVRAKMPTLGVCCGRVQKPAVQQEVCRIFGL